MKSLPLDPKRSSKRAENDVEIDETNESDSDVLEIRWTLDFEQHSYGFPLFSPSKML